MLQIAKARAVYLRSNACTNFWRVNASSLLSQSSKKGRIDTIISAVKSALQRGGHGRLDPLLVLCVWLLMLVMIGGWTHSSGIAHAQGFTSSVNDTYISSVLIVDNVSQIADHDPDGDRFQAAQLFVDLAPEGDQIGVVKISGQHKPESQLSGYQPLTPTDATGKSKLRSKLTAQVFGPVEGASDPNYPAYITPALQQAGNMLNQAPSGNRRYVIIMTDAVALSGDQDNCPSAPTYHKWFCAAQALEQQGLSVVLMGFTKPGTEAELTPTRNFLEAHGGTVLQVYDNTDLASNLAQNYAELLTGTHSNMFFASIQGLPGTLTLDQQIQPQSATFVALGDPGVSLATLDQPGETASVATRQTTDNSYYHSAPVGSDYALETISAGVIGGTWKVAPGAVPPRSLLVIVASAAHFDLQSPGAANPESDVSIRYLPASGPIALRASITASDGTPLTGIPFTADPGSLALPFKANALPGSAVMDIDALLPDPNNLGSILQVGIGKPLTGGVYLLKTFHVAENSALGPPLLNVPASTQLTQGASIHISAAGDSGLPGLDTANTALQIYVQSPQQGANWQLLNSGQNSAADDYVPMQGCGVIYQFLAVQEVQGQLASGQYNYVAYTQQPYRSNLLQEIIGQANAPDATYLEWWKSSIHWPVSVNSTTCSPQGTPLRLTLQGKTGSTPLITLVNGKGYSTTSDSAVFIARNNTTTTLQLSATLNGCPAFSFDDQITTLQLQLTDPDGPVVETGTWQTRMICPSVGTNAKRHWQLTLFGFLFLSIVFSRSGNKLLGLFARPYLGGTIRYKIAPPALKDDDEGDYTEAPTYNEILLPSRRHATTWYLDRCNDQTGIYYSLSIEESPLSVLKFMLKIIEGEPHVLMEASRFVSGDMTPTLRFSDENNLSLEPCYCEDNSEVVIIGQDTIQPDLCILP